LPDTESTWESLQAVALVGTYLPRQCGIATFTGDLAEAIAKARPEMQTLAVAMNDRPEGYRYPPRVWFEINQNRLAEYRLAADFLNMSAVSVCCVQHEFGIYGGGEGAHVLEMIRRLRMPVVATMHTVLKEPSDAQRAVVRQLAEECDRIVVMADRAVEFLHDIYGLEEGKVALIQHGIPDVPFVDPNYYKDQFEVEGKKVILTFGLLGPSKGLEQMIEAMPRVVEKHPDVVYMVLGATHPGVLAHSGEDYRLGLKRRAKELGIADNIKWFNKFVEIEELKEFLGCADVYVTSYLNEAQITSGTLAYAAGTGKAVVSTPYWHAQELLADGRGKIVPFKDTDALADAIIELFDNETERHAIRKRAYQHSRPMRWSEVARQYVELFETVRQERNKSPKPVAGTRQLRRADELPEIKLDHLRALTDDTGIFRYAKATIPDRDYGYSTDDNARALIAVLLAQEHLSQRAGKDTDLQITRHLSFLEHAFDPQAERFRDALSFARAWEDEQLEEPPHARAVWALGEAVARSTVRGHMVLAANLLHRALPACERFETLHGLAYALIGIHAYLRRFSGDSHARRVREALANKLFERFQAHEADDWRFPGDELTFASARVPHALLLSGRWMFNNDMIQMALRSLEWLHGVQSDGERFSPVGSEHPFAKGQAKPRFDQKPIEACASIDAYLEAYRVTADTKWIDRADACLNWFLGDNDLRTPLYDHTTGGCHDSLMPQGVNQNQGTESTTSWLLALLTLYDHSVEQETGSEARIPREKEAEVPPEASKAVEPTIKQADPPDARRKRPQRQAPATQQA